MARPRSVGIRRRPNALPPPRELERIASESGLIRRRRKLDPRTMLRTLVLGFRAGRTRSLADLRRVYQRVGGTSLADERTDEHRTLQSGPWVHRRLLILDLG